MCGSDKERRGRRDQVCVEVIKRGEGRRDQECVKG